RPEGAAGSLGAGVGGWGGGRWHSGSPNKGSRPSIGVRLRLMDHLNTSVSGRCSEQQILRCRPVLREVVSSSFRSHRRARQRIEQSAAGIRGTTERKSDVEGKR